MRTHPVQSSNIKEVGYDPEHKELRVIFTSGQVRDYSGVPADQYAGLMSAESYGKYFAANIKPRYAVATPGRAAQPVPEERPAPRDHVAALEKAARRYRGEA